MANNKVTVAVISDTHAYLEPQISEIIKTCDIAVHAGDICGADILDSMQPKTAKVYAVTGNNDPYCHTSKKNLPKVLSFEVAGEKITVEHGHVHGADKPSHDSLRETHTDSKIVIYGHTHKKVIDKEGQPWIINPGAAGKTRTHGGASCLVVECLENEEWVIKEYCFPNKG